MTPNTELSDEQINELAMRCCGVLHGDVLHMDRRQRIAFARRVLAASTPPLSEGAWVKEPSVTDMQFRLIDAKNALQHAADTAAPEVAKVYRQRASEVAVVISALSAASTPSGSEGAGTKGPGAAGVNPSRGGEQ